MEEKENIFILSWLDHVVVTTSTAVGIFNRPTIIIVGIIIHALACIISHYTC